MNGMGPTDSTNRTVYYYNTTNPAAVLNSLRIYGNDIIRWLKLMTIKKETRHMSTLRLTYFKLSISYIIVFMIVLVTNMIGCISTVQKDVIEKSYMNEPIKDPNCHLLGDLFTDKTHNFQLTLPNTKWTIEPTNEDDGNGNSTLVAELGRKGYDDFWAGIYVATFNVKDLDRFAGGMVGEYNPDMAKYTYIAGKPALWTSKIVDSDNYKVKTIIYQFVNDGIGYMISIAYLTQWSIDETFMTEIDDLLDSFTFLNKEYKNGELQITAGGEIGKGKLNNVAVLDMITLQSGKPNQITIALTNELQNALVKTGKVECLDRRNIEKVFQEHKLQQSNMVSGDVAITYGNLIGAEYLISSNLGQMGESSVIYIQITEVKSGKILKTVSSRCRKCNDNKLLSTVSKLAAKLTF